MSDVTVKQLAEGLKTPVDELLQKLKAAGIDKSADDTISAAEKMTLISALRSRGNIGSAQGGSKITLKRKISSELSVGVGREAKTVNVEVRKKRTYVQKGALDTAKLLAEQARQAELAQKAEIKAAATPAEEPAAPQVQETAPEAAPAATIAQTAPAPAAPEVAAAPEEAAPAPAAKKASKPKARPKAEELEDEEEQRHKKVAFKAKTSKARLEDEFVEEIDDSDAPLSTEEQERAQKAAKAAENIKREQERKARLKARGKAAPANNDSKPEARKRQELSIDKPARRRNRKGKSAPEEQQIKDNQHGFEKPVAPVAREVKVADTISVGDLAKEMAVKATELIKVLMKMGVMVTINQSLDQDTALLAIEEMGHIGIAVDAAAQEAQEIALEVINTSEKRPRPPVVTIMGHVDHGKTSLLDYIRNSKVASGEAGGITQHIGAYHVTTQRGIITFLDTPGHAAFTAMRARGAQVTDVVVLVVAADDGVMPQTIEAIQHAKAANVPLIVAVNKMDKPEADPDRVKNELSQHGVIPEDWGGENMFVHVSALKGDGIDDLLEGISLQADLLELTAPVKGAATGIVIESSLDKGRGPVATVLVQSGELKRGDMIVTGKEFGRVRAMFDERGQQIQTAGPSIPVQILGLSATPNAGDEMATATDERKAREIVQLRQDRDREHRLAKRAASKMEEAFSRMSDNTVETVNVLIKADVQGSVEALRDSLTKLSTDEVKLHVIAANVGGISETDALLAAASDAFLIGFNVRADNAAKRAVEEQGIELKYYNIIYDVINDVRDMMGGKLAPEITETIVGIATVKDVFKASGFGQVAGCIVSEGFVRKSLPIRVLRDNTVIYEGALESLRRFKDDVNEVRMGTECGIAVKNYNDVKLGDEIEVFERKETQRSIDG